MSFQAYLDAIEDKTGLTPRQLVELAKSRGFDGADVKAGEILAWLKQDYGLGRGHGMALVHVIKKGPKLMRNMLGPQVRTVMIPTRCGWMVKRPSQNKTSARALCA